MAKAAKAKGKKGSGGGVNSHVRARINYLHKAAAYLQSAATNRRSPEAAAKSQEDEDEVMTDLAHATQPASTIEFTTQSRLKDHSHIARICISQMRGVSQKSQLRLPIEQKRSFCKRCDTLLVLDTNCTQELKNLSRGARKPWAELRIVRCNICGTEKRFPQTDKRSCKLSERIKDKRAEDFSDEIKPV